MLYANLYLTAEPTEWSHLLSGQYLASEKADHSGLSTNFFLSLSLCISYRDKHVLLFSCIWYELLCMSWLASDLSVLDCHWAWRKLDFLCIFRVMQYSTIIRLCDYQIFSICALPCCRPGKIDIPRLEAGYPAKQWQQSQQQPRDFSLAGKFQSNDCFDSHLRIEYFFYLLYWSISKPNGVTILWLLTFSAAWEFYCVSLRSDYLFSFILCSPHQAYLQEIIWGQDQLSTLDSGKILFRLKIIFKLYV